MTSTMTDLFCGAGGSTAGAIQIPGLEVRMAANHWDLAIAVHNQNHPDTDHAAVDLHREDPRYFPRTDLLWASPECTKWSQANGKALPAIEEGLFEDPLSDEATHRSRLLMFDVLRFAEYHRYRVMIVENVVDIATQAKYRLAWQVWREELVKLGYRFRVISLNSMHAQAFGAPAPQSRDRLYIACWLDGNPAPDFDRILRPRAYCPRCAAVIESQQAWKPGKTVGKYRQAYLYAHAACGTIVEPGYLPAAAAIDWSIPGELIGDRLSPKTRARIAAGIARYWGQSFTLEAAGNTFERTPGVRTWPIDEVLRTLTTTATKALAVPVEGRDGKQAQPVQLPLRTQTTRQETAVVTPFIAELRGGGSDARTVTEPAATFCASGNHHGLVTPSGGTWNEDARPTSETLRTLTTRDAYSLVTPYYGNAKSARPTDAPIGTLTTVARYALVHRNNTGARPGVTPGDVKAAQEMVPACLFRMLRPHEVAAGMAFPTTYDWNVRNAAGRPPSNRDLVRMAGNAVTPPAARDLIAAVAESLGHDLSSLTT